ncbi:membrane protein insertion efficiency factor YidD [bacterium]|nr:membrane protein insertion efficiency factor YidD [bacterium]
MTKLLLFGIRLYQKLISPFLGKACRFYPSCSEYTYAAISKYGKKGLYKGIKRLLSCHPFHPGGIDPLD